METDPDDGLLINHASIKTYKKRNGHWKFEANNNYGNTGHDFHCMSTDPDDWETSDKGHRIEPCKSFYLFFINGVGFAGVGN